MSALLTNQTPYTRTILRSDWKKRLAVVQFQQHRGDIDQSYRWRTPRKCMSNWEKKTRFSWFKRYLSTDADRISPLESTATSLTCSLCPFKSFAIEAFSRSHTRTRVSIPPDTNPPAGRASLGGIQATVPTKFVWPTNVLSKLYSRSPSSEFQTLTDLSREPVAITPSCDTPKPRTWWYRTIKWRKFQGNPQFYT